MANDEKKPDAKTEDVDGSQPPKKHAGVKNETVTIVKNNTAALQVLQMPMVGKDSAGIPQIGGQVTLVPGVNLVPTRTLDELLKNHGVQMKFDEKIPMSMAPEADRTTVGQPFLVRGRELPVKQPLRTVTEEEARVIIEETLSTALLNNWQREEGRGDVRMMIVNRIEALKGSSNTNVAAAGR